MLPAGLLSSHEVGKNPLNKKRNRYLTTFPCTYTASYWLLRQTSIYNIKSTIVRHYFCFSIYKIKMSSAKRTFSKDFVYKQIYSVEALTTFMLVTFMLISDDHSRVQLKVTKMDQSDYINANYIDVSITIFVSMLN